MILLEFFRDIEEVEICVKEMKKLNIPVAVSMRLGPTGDDRGVPVEECAVRMANTGAEIIGNKSCVWHRPISASPLVYHLAPTLHPC